MLIMFVTRLNMWVLENSVVPRPGPPEINPDDVTPGWLGFAITAAFACVVIIVGFDMYRRVRRMRYREEVREEIAAELQAGDQKPE